MMFSPHLRYVVFGFFIPPVFYAIQMETDSIDNLIITGGTGFFGLHACNHFSSQDINVTTVDINPFQESDDIEDVEFAKGDVRNAELMKKVIKDADAVIHAASAIPTWDETEIKNATVDGTRTVLQAAQRNGVDRVVYISSAAVYGRRDRQPMTESTELRPRSLYGRAKLEAEEVCHEYRAKGMCVPIVRPQALIGRQRLGVFQILFDWVHTGATIPLIGAGNNKYQLLHVEDLISAIDLLLTADKGQVNTEFNVGAAKFNNMKEDFQSLIDYAGTGKRAIGTPAFLAIWSLRVLNYFNLSPLYPSLYETASEDTYLNVEKLKSIGWEPDYSNREALVDTFEWYRANYVADKSERGVGNRTAPDQKALLLVKKLFQII